MIIAHAYHLLHKRLSAPRYHAHLLVADIHFKFVFVSFLCVTGVTVLNNLWFQSRKCQTLLIQVLKLLLKLA